MTDVPGERDNDVARILVADDERKLVNLLTGALTHQGHEVAGGHGGAEALALVEAGFASLEDLRDQDARSVLNQMARVYRATGSPEQRLPTSAQVRLWLRRLPD